MIEDLLEEIKQRLTQTAAVDDAQRRDLLRLFDELREEVAGLSRTRAEHAQSITGFVGLSAHEATREHKDPQLLDLALKGLASSVEGFEASHPDLVKRVNDICLMLSNLGI
jgi:hypothetical protein